jgi:hypothetical protein
VPAGIDTDAAIPLDTDPPRHPHPRDTDVHDSAPPVDDTLPPGDSDPPVATFAMYAHTNNTLYSVDPATNQVARIGRFKNGQGFVVTMADIAIDAQGHLYAGGYDATANGGHSIYVVDPTTARVRRVCDVPLALTGLTFLSDGRLVAGADHALTAIDLTQRCAQVEIYRDDNQTTSGDVVGLPDGKLYWTVIGSGNDLLVVVDPVVGTATIAGTTGGSMLYGLGYDETADVLYGFSNASGRIVTIDPATAASHAVPGGSRIYWWGATTNPVVW